MPSAALSADFLAEECDFFSIGTNDLIQYTMAVDRVNEYVSYLYEPLHPSLLRLIGEVTNAANAASIPVSVCGEMAGEPMIAPVLFGLGVRELSMSAVSIPEVKATVRRPDSQAGARRAHQDHRRGGRDRHRPRSGYGPPKARVRSAALLIAWRLSRHAGLAGDSKRVYGRRDRALRHPLLAAR
jgi:signal transduction protein with GAF and PtsI domain